MASPPPLPAAGFLRSVTLFRSLPDETLEALAAATVERTYAGGETIIRCGDPGDGLYIVIAGLVQVIAGTDANHDAPVVAVFGPGEAFGELSLLDGKPRSASVLAAWSTRVLFLPRDAFLAHLDRHPETTRALLLVLAARLRETDRRLSQSA